MSRVTRCVDYGATKKLYCTMGYSVGKMGDSYRVGVRVGVRVRVRVRVRVVEQAFGRHDAVGARGGEVGGDVGGAAHVAVGQHGKATQRALHRGDLVEVCRPVAPARG